VHQSYLSDGRRSRSRKPSQSQLEYRTRPVKAADNPSQVRNLLVACHCEVLEFRRGPAVDAGATLPKLAEPGVG